MKKEIHPDYHEITVVLTDGQEFTTRSTYGEPGAVLRLDIDPSTHPAWTGGPQRVLDTGRVAKFRNKFKGSVGVVVETTHQSGVQSERDIEAR